MYRGKAKGRPFGASVTVGWNQVTTFSFVVEDLLTYLWRLERTKPSLRVWVVELGGTSEVI